jgi:S1-C subfamily serine protease
VAVVLLLASAPSLVACGDASRASRLPVPDRAPLESAIAAATPATVKITGSACGLATAGSGVVVATHLVLTAAHVVAGATESRVMDARGEHSAVPILVDPLSDMAVLYVDVLDEQPLSIDAGNAARGTIGVVLGYPHAGGLEVSPAVVLDAYRADGHDIYGRQAITRHVLEVQAEIVPGSSGGPIVDAHGTLIGMVFGQSENDPGIGYALTATAIREVVDAALGLSDGEPIPVSTGDCLAPEAGHS